MMTTWWKNKKLSEGEVKEENCSPQAQGKYNYVCTVF